MNFPHGLVVKNLPANAGDVRDAVLSVGWEDPREKEMATQSSILACELHSPRSLKESDTTEHPCKLSWKY